MGFILNVFYFILVMGILVFVHELGHLLAAKAFGVYCREFAIGMGPTVFKYKKEHWETTYSIRLLPLGGFVAMAGEPGEDDMNVDISRTIVGIQDVKRLVVLLAGIFMNIVLALVIYTGIFAVNGIAVQPEAKIVTIVDNFPAQKAGLQVGDTITSLTLSDGMVKPIKSIQDLQVSLSIYQDRDVLVTYTRDNLSHQVMVKPQVDPASGGYILGIQVPPATHENVSILRAIPLAFAQVGSVISQMVFLLSKMFKGIGTNNLGGPVAIFGVTSAIQVYGLLYFLNLVALLSVNLAVINLLPIPVMDGGRVVLTLIEMIIRRPVPEKIQNSVIMGSVVLLIAFFIFITYNDILKML